MSEPDNIIIVQWLNSLLQLKLASINQYFMHARILKHQGHIQLADQEYMASISAMKHTDTLVEQILAWDGMPSLQATDALEIHSLPHKMLRNDLSIAEKLLSRLQEIYQLCQAHYPQLKLNVLDSLLEYQHEHIAFITSQIELHCTPIKAV